MKSKFKENGKNRILAVIASAVMFCLVVLLIIVTRKTDAVADTSVIINGKEYSQDNKMKILEIVSEDYYDELGPIIGNSSGSVKWDDIVAKATDKKVASNSDVQKNMDVYLRYVNGILLNGTNYNLCLEYKSGNSYNYYTTSNDAIQKVGTLDVDNIKLIFCKKDGNSYIPMTTKNGSFFSRFEVIINYLVAIFVININISYISTIIFTCNASAYAFFGMSKISNKLISVYARHSKTYSCNIRILIITSSRLILRIIHYGFSFSGILHIQVKCCFRW